MQEKIDNKMVGKTDNKCKECEFKKKCKEVEEAEVVGEGDEE